MFILPVKTLMYFKEERTLGTNIAGFVHLNPVGGLPCKFEGILESPLVNGYRNKCEFSVGYSLQGKATVGFMLGNFR